LAETANVEQPGKFSGVNRGYQVKDPYLESLQGHSKARYFAGKSHLLYGEIKEVFQDVFPYTLNREPLFEIRGISNDEIRSLLTRIVINDDIRRIVRTNHEKLYQTHLGLKGFLDSVTNDLIVHGFTYCAITWQDISFENFKMVVPVRIRRMPPETMRMTKENTFIQAYSRFGVPKHPHLQGIEVQFEAHEMMYFEYFSETTPTEASIKFAKSDDELEHLLLQQSKAQAYPENISLELEKLRYIPSSVLKRNLALNRAKIRKEFQLPVDSVWSTSDLEFTETYKALRLVQHLKYLNRFREYLQSVFNDQFMTTISNLNEWTDIPSIAYVGNSPNNLEIASAYEAYQGKTLQYEDFRRQLLRY